MSVVQIITFRAKPEKLAQFTDLMQSLKATLPSVPGCEAVRIHQGTDDPCAFTLVETWITEDRHREHIAELQKSGAWSDVAALLAGEPASGYFVEV